MKRTSRKRACRPQTAPPSVDVLRRYIEALADDHQREFQAELAGKAPHWEYLVGLHLRLAELEHMETAAGEFL